MCQQFDTKRINDHADLATPNGTYICYTCNPTPEQVEGSPLPWSVERGILIRDAERNEVAAPPLSLRDNTKAKADAAFIVTAVNSHEALVTALEGALTALRYMRDADTQHWDFHVTPDVCNAWDAARTALALAGRNANGK